MASGITCIVTIHGIGFQQPPTAGVPPDEDIPGYADDLHSHLCSALNQYGKVLLSDDPNRQAYQHGDSVPIYVQSAWPPKTARRENGMRRLGTWVGNHQATVNHDDTQKLVKGDARIAHVALVYSGLEGQGPEAEAAFIAGAETILFARRYSNFLGLFHEIFQDTQPFWQSLWTKWFKRHPHEDPQKEPRTSLRIRQDESYPHKKASTNGSSGQPGPTESLLRELENDVAIYVCHNGRRERIRGFIEDALLRLACRDDVSSIVLNTHSNGTVIGLDIVQELPSFATEKIRAIITAGSPIRKYVDLFSWGKHIAVMPKIKRWWNFWDEKDIVGDKLLPCAGWRRGTEPTPDQLIGIYQTLDPDTGEITSTPIKDIQVHNIPNSPSGGMQAHNYWDNEEEFIPKVVELLKEVMAAEESSVVGEAMPLEAK